jgi:hypothetical protein
VFEDQKKKEEEKNAYKVTVIPFKTILTDLPSVLRIEKVTSKNTLNCFWY